MRHKWSLDDTCEKCGLKRRWTKISPKGTVGFLFGRPSHQYFVNGEWIMEKVECVGSANKKSPTN